MPIIKYKNVTLHFAHIPKCAGTSIEGYIKHINGAELAFVDMHYVASPAKQPWNISSPQHIDGVSFARLFPKTFFNAFFSVVRDPLSRVKSAYRFQRFSEKTIDGNTSLDDFVQNELSDCYSLIGWKDNHFLPQTSFLYPKTAYQFFKLEQNGVEAAKHYIDRMLFGNRIDLAMRHSNPAKKAINVDTDELTLSDKSIDVLCDIYQSDFDRFKYQYPNK